MEAGDIRSGFGFELQRRLHGFVQHRGCDQHRRWATRKARLEALDVCVRRETDPERCPPSRRVGGMASIEMNGTGLQQNGESIQQNGHAIGQYCLLQLGLFASRLQRSHIQRAGTGQQVNGDSAPGVSHHDVEGGHQHHHHHHLATYSHPWEHRIFQGKPVPDHIR